MQLIPLMILKQRNYLKLEKRYNTIIIWMLIINVNVNVNHNNINLFHLKKSLAESLIIWILYNSSFLSLPLYSLSLPFFLHLSLTILLIFPVTLSLIFPLKLSLSLSLSSLFLSLPFVN